MDGFNGNAGGVIEMGMGLIETWVGVIAMRMGLIVMRVGLIATRHATSLLSEKSQTHKSSLRVRTEKS